MAYDSTTYKPRSSQKVAYTGTAASAVALSSGVDVVRLVAESDCHISIGSTAVADGTGM